MSDLTLFDELTPIDVHLSNLFLDPNNPRFAEFEGGFVGDDSVEAAQARVHQQLVQLYQTDKLRLSMEVNGYLPIDRVVVRQLHGDKYVLLEGNRRIAAAKSLVEMHQSGVVQSPKVLQSLAKIPCLLYTGTEDDAAWVFQGLRHISGVHEWSSFNKAKLLVDQM